MKNDTQLNRLANPEQTSHFVWATTFRIDYYDYPSLQLEPK